MDGVAWLTVLDGNQCNPNPAQPCWAETYQMWKHLALTDIFVHVETGANPANPEWGVTHPAAPMGGGFELFYDGWMATGGGGANISASHILRLSNGGLTGFGGAGNRGLVTPVMAERIDIKMDNGLPNSGTVLANYGARNDSCKTSVPEGYRTDLEDRSCILYFQILR